MAPNKKKIVVTHVYSDSNKGDSAISACTIDAILSANPNNLITAHSVFTECDPDFHYHNRFLGKKKINIEEGVMPSPHIGTEKYLFSDVVALIRLLYTYIQYSAALHFPKLPGIGSKKQKNAVDRIRNADIVVLKGGQYIYNNSESIRGWFFLWRTLLPIRCALKLNKKVILFGQSIGPFKTKKSFKYVLKTLLKCHKIVLREKLSLTLFEKEGVEKSKFILAPDLAFLTIPEQIPMIKSVQKNQLRSFFGITVVNWSFPNHPDPEAAKKNYTNNLIEAIKTVSIKYQLTPVLIPQVSVRHHGVSDLDLLNQIKTSLEKNLIQSIIIKKDFSPSQMAGLYKQCEFLIGTRLHSCILAATAGIPVIAIRYQGFKTQGIMDDLGMSEFVHDISSVKSNELCQSVDDIMGNRDEIIKTINKNTNKMRTTLTAISNELFNLA